MDTYPRPQLVRDSFFSLDGRWSLFLSDENGQVSEYTITVPFSPETEAAELEKDGLKTPGFTLKPHCFMRYRREVAFPEPVDFSKEKLLLHFGAVDYRALVYIDGVLVKEHVGGYLPFSVEVEKSSFLLEVSVQDPTDTQNIIRGKQVLSSGGIWYPGQSGIWQSIWMEKVPKNYIQSLETTPSLNGFELCAKTEVTCKLIIEIENKEIKTESNKSLFIEIQNPHLWSPEDPYLYLFSVRTETDSVSSYTALRTFCVKDGDLYLNNKKYFCHGLLDQGYWKEGLYTPLSTAQMKEDILFAKRLGFNTLRKHIKVEPLVWYYLCDTLGMLVWQDMVSGGGKYKAFPHSAPLFIGSFLSDTKAKSQSRLGSEDKEYQERFISEAVQTIRHLKNCPSIVLWSVFNEGWGQFDSSKVAKQLIQEDSSRPMDYTSGWHDQGDGPFKSVHVYFKKYHYRKDKRGRCVILSEFGGYGLNLNKAEKKTFTYKKLKSKEDLTEAIVKLYKSQILPAKQKGLSACIYTQISDVLQETNGLITFDRKTVKVNETEIRKISESLKVFN